MQRTVGVVGTSDEDFNVSELLAQVKALEVGDTIRKMCYMSVVLSVGICCFVFSVRTISSLVSV